MDSKTKYDFLRIFVFILSLHKDLTNDFVDLPKGASKSSNSANISGLTSITSSATAMRFSFLSFSMLLSCLGKYTGSFVFTMVNRKSLSTCCSPFWCGSGR